MGLRRKGIAQRLGTECAKARLAAHVKAETVAARAGNGVSPPVLSRFENGYGWPRHVERIVRAYELECGLEPEDLWRRAICR